VVKNASICHAPLSMIAGISTIRTKRQSPVICT
jgi:hypothetical protein